MRRIHSVNLGSALAAWCALSGCQAPPLALRVVDASTGQPIRDAEVTRVSYEYHLLLPATTSGKEIGKTDERGQIGPPLDVSDDQTLLLTAPGYRMAEVRTASGATAYVCSPAVTRPIANVADFLFVRGDEFPYSAAQRVRYGPESPLVVRLITR